MNNSDQCQILEPSLKTAETLPPSESMDQIDLIKKLFHIMRMSENKKKAEQLGAEATQRQEQIKFIKDIKAEINNLTDKQQFSLDISKSEALQEKLRAAKELGVQIPEGQTTFSSIERNFLIENLDSSIDGWNKENQTLTQQMDIYMRELDRYMMLLTEATKKQSQTIKKFSDGIRGG